MEELASTGDTLEEVQKINNLAVNFYKLHLAASMADAVEMARNTLQGASRLEMRTATHLPDKLPEEHLEEAMEVAAPPVDVPPQVIKELELPETPIQEEQVEPEKPAEVQTTLEVRNG